MRNIFIGLLFGAFLLCSTGVLAQAPESYESLMKSGNTKFAAKDYISAKTYYEMALKQKPKDAVAQQKLNETLVKIQADSERQEVFYAHLDAGDALHAQDKYEEALAEYEQALAIFPDDKYVGAQADAIRGILKERRDKQEAYDRAIEQGNTLLEGENFEAAILQFEAAAKIFPNDKLPKERITEARRLQQIYNDKTAQFNKLVSDADQLALRKNYNDAIAKLNQALEIFPDDTSVSGKIQEYQSLRDLNDRYNTLIAEADRLYENKQYTEARTAYQGVFAVVPNDAYATDMIRRINELFESPEYIAEQNYLAAMTRGAELLGQEQYQMALNTYQEALTYKPGDLAATQKVNEITATIHRLEEEAEAARLAAEQAAAEEAARLAAEAEAARLAAEAEAARLAAEAAAEAERQERIQQMLGVADGLFAEEKYVEAKTKYQEVFTLDEGNAAATAKINEIDGIFAQIAAEAQQRFDEAMAAGARYMNEEDYQNAIAQYQLALVAKPDNAEATAQLQAAQRMESDRVSALRTQYNTFIKEGDKQFAAKALDKAVESYVKAEELGLGEPYPSEMIERISRIIEENKLYELNNEAFTMTANTPRRFTFNPVDVASRRSNYIILKARNLTPGKSFPMIVSFGSENGKNGGFVLAISDSEETKTYLFRIGSQYKWFSEDNTWIELISENDDVEVSMVEISRSN